MSNFSKTVCLGAGTTGFIHCNMKLQADPNEDKFLHSAVTLFGNSLERRFNLRVFIAKKKKK